MIEIKNIKKNFGSNHVLKGINLQLSRGKIIGFVGANGSGKTTLIKALLGLLNIDAGIMKINNEQILFGETKTNKYIGYLPDVPEFYPYYSGKEFLNLVADVSNLTNKEARIKDVLNDVGLNSNQTLVSDYSRGMKQRLGFAQAILHDPDVLICDEPTSALDPNGRNQILQLIKNKRDQTTVFFSTHILSDIEEIADEVVFLKDGKIVFHESIVALKSKISSEYLLEVVGKDLLTFNILTEINLEFAHEKENTFIIKNTTNQLNLQLLKKLTEQNILIKKFIIIEQSLHDIMKDVIV